MQHSEYLSILKTYILMTLLNYWELNQIQYVVYICRVWTKNKPGGINSWQYQARQVKCRIASKKADRDKWRHSVQASHHGKREAKKGGDH